MKKLLPILLTALNSLLIGAGGAVGVMKVMGGGSPHGGASAPVKAEVKKEPPQKILFADLSDVTVSVPPQPGTAATSYVSFSVKFSTLDPAAILAFAELQPIIKSAIITRLMNETTQSLQDQRNRIDLTKSCLTIVNTVMVRDGNFSAPTPFTAAYITNLVTQD